MTAWTATFETQEIPPSREWRTFQQERAEVFAGILMELNGACADPDAAAACASLLQHLTRYVPYGVSVTPLS